MKSYTRILTIAGSDSGGGAGVQADIKTISACGGYAASAVTAITVQNTLGVQAVYPLPLSAIAEQITAVLSDIGADAVKIGMLHSSDVVRTVAQTLREHQCTNIVLDPVMVSTSGHALLEPDAVACLKSELIPMARVITPNLPEAAMLLGETNNWTTHDLPHVAERLAHLTGVSVLLKAGHLVEDTLVDILYDYDNKQFTELPSVRIDTNNTHGTGCTLSSALATYLGKGLSLSEAAQQAKAYINGAIRTGAEYKIGHGFGPVAHFWQ